MDDYDKTDIADLNQRIEKLEAEIEAYKDFGRSKDIHKIIQLEALSVSKTETILALQRKGMRVEKRLGAVRDACRFTKYPPYHVIDVDHDKIQAALNGENDAV